MPLRQQPNSGTRPVPSTNMERNAGQRLYVWSLPAAIPFGVLTLLTDDIAWMIGPLIIAAIGLLLLFLDG